MISPVMKQESGDCLFSCCIGTSSDNTIGDNDRDNTSITDDDEVVMTQLHFVLSSYIVSLQTQPSSSSLIALSVSDGDGGGYPSAVVEYGCSSLSRALEVQYCWNVASRCDVYLYTSPCARVSTRSRNCRCTCETTTKLHTNRVHLKPP
jgi:hypothetical protein